MAYMSQERKKSLAPAIKAHCKKFGVKATIGVHHHSTLVVNIKSSKIDFIDDYYNKMITAPNANMYWGANKPSKDSIKNIQVNQYHLKSGHSGKALKFLEGLVELMNIGNHDNSDIMTDYFDVGWYTDINIGQWNKPYEVTK